jgi:pectate lyase
MRSNRRRSLTACIASTAWLALAGAVHAQPIEGFGSITKGGAGGDVYHVTTLADSGQGSLRWGLDNRSPKPLTIVFDVGGTISLTKDILVNEPFLTIDGSSAPSPGITITQDWFTWEFVVGGTHDVILKNLRFLGLFVDGGQTGGNNAVVTIDGDRKPGLRVDRIVFDHVTVTRAGDAGPDIWGNAADITIQWCLFFDSLHPTTVSGYGTQVNTVRQRISMHHNVYALNSERNPQLRADVRTYDYVNNVVYGWGSKPKSNPNAGYGVRVRNEPDEPKVEGLNVVNNAFVVLPNLRTAWGLVYGDKPGPDIQDGGPAQPVPQGHLVTNSRMGKIWVSGNMLPKFNQDHWSTVPAPIPISKPVTTWPATALKDTVLPLVGTLYRTVAEQQLLDTVAQALSELPGPGPSPSPSPSPTPTPRPSPTASPTPRPSPSPTATPRPSPSPRPDPREHRHEGDWEKFKRRLQQAYCEFAGC